MSHSIEGSPVSPTSPGGAAVHSQGRKPLDNKQPHTQAPEGRKKGRRMPQSFASLHCHIIFSTKHRMPWITPELQPRLYEYTGGILRNHDCALIAAGGVPDHVHLLVSLHRTMDVAEVVGLIKANSSKWIHETFPEHHDFAWQIGYGAFTVSYSNIPQVKRYLASQAEHHRRRSFQKEFLEFLKRHDIKYDERYVWE